MIGFGLIVELAAVGDAHHARVGVDRKRPAHDRIAELVHQGIGDRIVGGIRIRRGRRHAHHSAVGGRFRDRVRGRVAVARRGHVELVDIVDLDRVALHGSGAITGCGRDLDVMRGRRFPVDGAGHRDHARIGVDGEQAARIVAQAIGHRVRAVRVGCQSRHAHHRAHGAILIHRVGRGVAVRHRLDAAEIDIRLRRVRRSPAISNCCCNGGDRRRR